MHREIKFRVWDMQSKQWVESYSSIHNDCISINECFEKGKYAFMQFTGIKDRNGKEIFEGDIVNVNGGNHIIEWRGAGFAATWSDYNLDTCWFVGGGPVVIGNIFENPELAEKARKSPRL